MEPCELLIKHQENCDVRWCSCLCELWPLGWVAYPSVARWYNRKCHCLHEFSPGFWTFPKVLQHERISSLGWLEAKFPIEVNKSLSQAVQDASLPLTWWLLGLSPAPGVTPAWGKNRKRKISGGWHQTSTFTRWDANSFIYIIVCNFLACANSPKWSN